MKPLCLLLFFLVWFSASVFLIVFGALFWRDYNQFKNHRIHEQIGIRNSVETYCKDADSMIKNVMVEFCHERQHMLEEDPNEYAIYDTLNNRGLCFGYSCTYIFGNDAASAINTVVTIGIIVVIILSLCGIKVMGLGISQYSTQYLPTTTTSLSSSMVNNKKVS